MASTDTKTERTIVPLRELLQASRIALETKFADVWTEGEVVECSTQSHTYFRIREVTGNKASTRVPVTMSCVLYAQDAFSLRTPIAIGRTLHLFGRLTVHEPKGALQMRVMNALDAGAGLRAEATLALRNRLRAEGLFELARKKSLPLIAKSVGLVTSRDGAALLDIQRVARDRMPTRLILSHCQVQGDGAERAIADAIRAIDGKVDVIIVARGGGSSEDLQAFNSEAVVRAIAEAETPIVTGIGHEVDVLLADHAADKRAATPTQAAEMVLASPKLLTRELDARKRRLWKGWEDILRAGRAQLELLLQTLSAPTLSTAHARIASFQFAMESGAFAKHAQANERHTMLANRLHRVDPQVSLKNADAKRAGLLIALTRGAETRQNAARMQAVSLHERLYAVGKTLPLSSRHRLSHAIGQLDALSPLQVLARGYAIATSLTTKQAITDAKTLAVGDLVHVRVQVGSFHARIETTEMPTG